MTAVTSLDRTAGDYHSRIIEGWGRLYGKKRQRLYRELKRYSAPGAALEMGCADGRMTELLCADFSRVTVVDGAEQFLREVGERVAATNLRLVHSLFEEFDPGTERFDSIFMTHILEHLDDPVGTLRRAAGWLAAGGRVLIAVPNADSIHRLVGVKMGMLARKDELNEQDLALGHRRVYTPELLLGQVEESGLRVVQFGGVMVKPLSNRQIEANWSEELIDAFFALSEELPRLCSEIYVAAELP